MLDGSSRTDGSDGLADTVPLVDVIEDKDAFAALKPAWTDVYLADPEATVFLSWDWINGAFRENPRRWRVYVARNPENPAQIVALLPLRLRVHWSRDREEFTTELAAAGQLLHSVYTGFLCRPGWEGTALSAIVARLAKAPWSELSLRYVSSGARAQAFAAAFDATEFKLSWRNYFVNKGQTDNLLCPRIALPDSFETYLQTQPKPEMQARIRRFRRRYLQQGDWQITQSDPETLGRDLDILIDSWVLDQNAARGDGAAAQGAHKLRQSLELAAGMDCLRLSVLWSGDAAIGALAHVLDHNMDRMHVILGGAAHGQEAGSIALLLHAESIRWGIENGFADYDFGPGNLPETYALGARDAQVHYVVLRRRMVPRAFALDRLCLPDAVARVTDMVAIGKTERAAKALEQIAKLV